MKQKKLFYLEKYLRILYGLIYLRPMYIFKVLTNKKYYTALSYYPEKKRKSTSLILAEQLFYVLKHGAVNDFYFLFGFDIKKFRNQNEYIDYNTSQRILTATNSPSDKPFSYITLLRDKFFFNLIFSALGFKTSPIIGVVDSGKLYIHKTKEWSILSNYLQNNTVDIFCKAVGGQCGEDIYVVQSNGKDFIVNGNLHTLDSFLNLINIGLWVLENRVIQHPELAKYHPQSVNTLRLHTVRNIRKGTIEVFPSTFRVGADGNKVDNWARGGLIIEISTDGLLGEFGYYKPNYNKTKATKHPNTQVIFKGQRIPMYKEAVNMVMKMHEFLPGLHSIGWDIAITEEGPLVIEGNDNWEITFPQTLTKGMKNDFIKNIKNI